MTGEYEQVDYLTESIGINWQALNEYGFVSPWAPRLWRASATRNYLISTLATLTIAATAAALSQQCQHWCLIPLVFCGIIIGDGIGAWLRREIDLFDPKVIVSGALYLNCFLAPVLHLAYNLYGENFDVSDWPSYFGYMACFNFVGLLSLKIGHHILFNLSRPPKRFWRISSGRFVSILLAVVGISIAATLVIKLFFGGLVKETGVISFAAGSEAYAGHLSWITMLSDPLPILLAIVIVYWLERKNQDKPTSVLMVVLILILTMGLHLSLFGLRGSRSTILSGVLIVLVMIHYRLRPLSMKFLIVSFCFMLVFIYLYGFYKRFGRRGWEAFYSAEARSAMVYEAGGGNTVSFLIGQLAKADLQAFMVYRLMEYKGLYKFRKGQTYVMSILTFIPRAVWKNKPRSVKAVAGTELQGFSGTEYSSAVYLLAGEAMLNFGFYGIPPAFFVFGCVLGWLRKKIATIEPSDARFFLIPILILMSYFALGDTNNWTNGLLRIGVLPFIVVFLGSFKHRLET
jgi:hypothetical protein